MPEPLFPEFKEEFDRAHECLVKCIDACPDTLWTDNTGNLPFWLHLLHTFASVERYAAPFDAPPKQTFLPYEVYAFKTRPDRVMGKDEVRAFAAEMEKVAHAYFASLTVADLPKKNEIMSRSLGRDRTHLNALIALPRHLNYHLGCCDTVLRANGLPGMM